MLCQNCKLGEASSHIHMVVNGVVRDIYLCSECASNKHVKSVFNDDIFDLLSSFLTVGNVGNNHIEKCECCGTSYETISKLGRVGCGNCYKTFIRQLEPALIRLHGKTSHVGKRIDSVGNSENQKEDAKTYIEELQNELNVAIQNEEYENAAIIRDKIKKLKEDK